MSKPVRQILFTFDYELFLGKKSGTVDNCLIIPTNKLLAIFEKYQLKTIFFVDTTYLIELNKIKDLYPPVKEDWGKIVKQIEDIFRKGHDVFPHLHPHWLDAKYVVETNEWDLTDFSKYRFNSIPLEQRDYIWTESMRILCSIIHPINSEYKFDAYRAGGWCIQPFDDFKPYFEKYGIKYEFSIKPGYKQLTTAHQYDFINAPHKNIYSFDEDILVENSKGRYTELTISSIEKISGIYNLANRVFYKILPYRIKKGFGDGVTVDGKSIEHKDSKQRADTTAMVSIEDLTLVKLLFYFNFLRKNTYMQFLSHPKIINKHQIFCFNYFLKLVRLRYSLNSNFKNNNIL